MRQANLISNKFFPVLPIQIEFGHLWLVSSPSPCSQDENWTYVRRSEDVLDVMWTPYV